MIEIALNEIEFFAYHGYYEEEREIGNTFFLDINVQLNDLKEVENDDLQNTVNYERLYKIAEEEMAIPVKLLETVVFKITEKIFKEFPAVIAAQVTLRKSNPPIGGKCKDAAVKITRTR